MTDSEILRLLNSIGKRVFVEYYEVFKDSGLSTDDKISKLPEEYSYNGSRTRVNCANRIFENKCQTRALQMVTNAKVEDWVISKANKLLIEQN